MKNIKIISGGQTGVDRAALDFALENNIQCGGYCPKGRRADDGPISPNYPLIETKTTLYPERTKMNILESEGTLIIYKTKFDRGTGLTLKLCKELKKPYFIVKIDPGYGIKECLSWLNDHIILILNIAGPRESSEPGIYSETKKFLKNLFRML